MHQLHLTNVASVQSFNGTHWFREASLFGGIGVPASQQGLLMKLALMFDILLNEITSV